jgi:simple sugar transport system permease protein
MVAGRGLAQLINDGNTVSFHLASFEFIGRGTVLALPFPIILLALVYTGMGLARTKTAAGLFIEAVGDNETSSQNAGVNPRRVKLLVYAVCGLCAGLAGIIAVSDLMTSDPGGAGLNLELDAILACVIGGASLQGGRFSLTGSILGSVLIQTLTTTILTRGVSDRLTLVVKAVVIIGVCLLQAPGFQRWLSATRRRAA